MGLVSQIHGLWQTALSTLKSEDSSSFIILIFNRMITWKANLVKKKNEANFCDAQILNNAFFIYLTPFNFPNTKKLSKCSCTYVDKAWTRTFSSTINGTGGDASPNFSNYNKCLYVNVNSLQTDSYLL